MILDIFNNYRGYHSYQNYECCDNTVVREQKIKWGFTPMDQSAHPSIHPSTKITKTIGVIRSYVVWTFSIVTVQKLPQLPTLPKYHTIFLNKHHGTYRATTETKPYYIVLLLLDTIIITEKLSILFQVKERHIFRDVCLIFEHFQRFLWQGFSDEVFQRNCLTFQQETPICLTL